MKPSTGVTSIWVRLPSRPASTFASVASATQASQRSRCCSSASDLTVRTPCRVSTMTLDLADPASIQRFTRLLIGRMEPAIAAAIRPAESSTTQDSTGCK